MSMGAVGGDKVKGDDVGCKVGDDGGAIDAPGWATYLSGFRSNRTRCNADERRVGVGGGLFDEFCALGHVLPLVGKW
jgi:hypothetical protein